VWEVVRQGSRQVAGGIQVVSAAQQVAKVGGGRVRQNVMAGSTIYSGRMVAWQNPH